MESILLDTMFDLPSPEGVGEVMISRSWMEPRPHCGAQIGPATQAPERAPGMVVRPLQTRHQPQKELVRAFPRLAYQEVSECQFVVRATERRQLVVIVGGFARACIASNGPIDSHQTPPPSRHREEPIARQMWRLCYGRIGEVAAH
jgi:hypothetical protein